MRRSSTLSRLERLDLLKSRLMSGDILTVADISAELSVSVRTLSRDIDLLREQGVPIEADRGRGGGIRMRSNWATGRINFTYTEAVDLMITLAIAQQMKSPLFMANLDGIRRKLDSSFSPRMKQKLKSLKRRILISPSASLDVLSGFSPPKKSLTEKLHQAFLLQQPIAIRYRAKNGVITRRDIEPHCLMLSYPVWYVIAWDRLRDDARTFRCDRIMSIQNGQDEFELRPMSDFKACIDGVDVI